MTADEIIAFREKYGLSQTALGEMLGVFQPVVSRWERGVNKLSPAYVQLFRALGERLDQERAKPKRVKELHAGWTAGR